MASKLIKSDIPASSNGTPMPTDVSDMLRQLRSRSPQESLGVSEQSGLGRSFIQATIITAIVFALLTLGPYFYEKAYPPAPKQAKTHANENPENANPTPSNPSADNTAKKGPETLTTQPKVAGKKDILDVLGESGTKSGTPKGGNPLDRKEDDLLKDLK